MQRIGITQVMKFAAKPITWEPLFNWWPGFHITVTVENEVVIGAIEDAGAVGGIAITRM